MVRRGPLGLGDALLVGTIAFAMVVTAVGLSGLDVPWLTLLLSQSVILYFLTAIIVLVLVAMFISFEEGRASAHEVAIIAVLSAASIALRVAFAALPNVQPSTFIILTAGVVHGPRAGFMVGGYADTTLFITNVGGDTLRGDLSETCPHFDIIEGAGPFALATEDTLDVIVRFQPASTGNRMRF